MTRYTQEKEDLVSLSSVEFEQCWCSWCSQTSSLYLPSTHLYLSWRRLATSIGLEKWTILAENYLKHFHQVGFGLESACNNFLFFFYSGFISI